MLNFDIRIFKASGKFYQDATVQIISYADRPFFETVAAVEKYRAYKWPGYFLEILKSDHPDGYPVLLIPREE